ncbi:hypothetical protein BDV10DRAFT_166515 [Aspergillus recurvatus]
MRVCTFAQVIGLCCSCSVAESNTDTTGVTWALLQECDGTCIAYILFEIFLTPTSKQTRRSETRLTCLRSQCSQCRNIQN